MALQSSWATDLLKAGGYPVTKKNVKFLQDWHRWEGGGDANAASFNPLNTTLGKQYPSINSVGVRAFPDSRTGIAQTLATIGNGRYPNIVRGLQAGNPYGAQISSDLSTWVSGRPDSEHGLRYASRVLGGRAQSAPAVGVRSGKPPARDRSAAARKVLAQGLLGFAQRYAETGEVSSDSVATLMGAVSKAGTVEPPVFKGDIPKSKGRGQLGNGIVDRVLAAAHTQVGKPYVFGSGPDTSSFDCSDLVQWAYKQVGIDIPRVAIDQMRSLPAKSWKNIAPGDLIFRDDGGHVVMYVGGGKVIAAPHTGTVVQYQPLSNFRKGYQVRGVV